MFNLNKEKSITGQVNVSTRLITTVLIIPAILSLVIMLIFSASYHSSVSRMEAVAELKPMVGINLPDEQVWSAVAGRTSFAESGANETIDIVNTTLDQLIAQGSGTSQLELIVARRTMDTLADYVATIEKNMASGAPISESEAILEVVRDVAKLIDSMLENYITEEIGNAAATNARLNRVVLISAIIEVLVLVGALWIANVTRQKMARFIHDPIEKLEHFAGLLADGNLQARVPATDVTELTTLTNRVNIMANRLESLIVQNKQEQENLKKSELRILQAQINPHFLYNTLDAIIWQAEAGHSDEVIHITKALSDFFRISLSSGADWIPISQEMKHLVGYLSIQKIRYRDILNYQVDIAPAISDTYILKLLLQPLVENALYHGIKHKRGGGCITVTGMQIDNRLYFQVKDTGRGMSPDQLAEISARMRGEKSPIYTPYANNGSGFGLHNVDQRIRLYYNQDEGLHVESGTEGTTVSFSVPVREKEDILHV